MASVEIKYPVVLKVRSPTEMFNFTVMGFNRKACK